MINVSGLLEQIAHRHPGAPAIISGGKTVNFGELARDVHRLAEGLSSIGVAPGKRVALMVPPGPEMFALTFALFKMGAVPVLIDPGIGWSNLGKCLAESAPEAFIGVPKAHAARLLGRWAHSSVKLSVTVGRRWFWGGWTYSGLLAHEEGRGVNFPETSHEAAAAILFTSGSTGVPKGAVYTHAMFMAQIGALKHHFGIIPGEVSVATFPLFALFDVALGMTVVIPDMDPSRPVSADPELLFSAITRHQATQLFASPALLDKLGRYGESRGIKLPSLKRVISAGAPVAAKILKRFAPLLDERALIHTPYGATESLPVCCIEHPEILAETGKLTEEGRGICVGRPLPGMDVKVISISDESITEWSQGMVLAPGEVGEITTSGDVVSAAYDQRPDLTTLAKIRDGDGVRHRMGDLGSFDAQGRLWFFGRKSQRVKTKEGSSFTIACEGVFNRHPAVRRSALVGVAGSPVLCVELENKVSRRDVVREELLSLASTYPHTSGIKTILFHKSFPVDIRHNAKIFREKLAVWAQKELAPRCAGQSLPVSNRNGT